MSPFVNWIRQVKLEFSMYSERAHNTGPGRRKAGLNGVGRVILRV